MHLAAHQFDQFADQGEAEAAALLAAQTDLSALVVEKHKGAGFNRYFRKFAETPMEKFAAQVIGPLIGVLLSIRARTKRG